MSKITYVPVVDACDLPREVDAWCCDNDMFTHYENGLYQVSDDGNPFAEWLKQQGFLFDKTKSFDWIGILGT